MEETYSEHVAEKQENAAAAEPNLAAETTTVGTAATDAASPIKKQKNQYFSARRIAYIAIFTALSFAVRQLSFPLLPAVGFLKFDFSDLFVLICGYAVGPVAGVITGVLKEVISITTSDTVGVGELANILVLVPFVLLPSLMYKKHKGIKSVILWLSVACIVRIAWSVPVNYTLTFPAFTAAFGGTWEGGMNLFLEVWYYVVLFNLIKTVILAVLTLLLYKSVSRLISLINKKFDDRKAAKNTSQTQ